MLTIFCPWFRKRSLTLTPCVNKPPGLVRKSRTRVFMPRPSSALTAPVTSFAVESLKALRSTYPTPSPSVATRLTAL